MRILTLTNYELPLEYSAILFKTLGDAVTIEDWATSNREVIDEDAVVIIFKSCNDLPLPVYKNPAIINSTTIFISKSFSDPSIRRLIKQNILGFIDYNDLNIKTLQAAINTCSSGSLFISPSILSLYKDDVVEKKETSLSKRELEIVRLIGEELTSQEIASRLYLSKRTVDTHRKNAMEKLNTHNTAGLIKLAMGNNLILSILHIAWHTIGFLSITFLDEL